jgi:predicted enzyme related to lactoylglutathione lyase
MPLVEPVPGRFCWFELGTTDRTAAVAFYRAIFGWTPTETPLGPGGEYTILTLGDQEVAAAYELTTEMRERHVGTHWMVYVSVTDVDATTAAATALGATVIRPPFEAGPNGRMSVLMDPTGAAFSLWQGRANLGVRLVGDPGTAVWVDLSTSDPARAIAFYGQLFGWKLVDGKNMVTATAGDYVHIVNGDTFIGGIQPAAHRNPKEPPHWLTYFEVADCDATLATIRLLGGRVYMEPRAIEKVRRVAVAGDPQGGTFALVEHVRPA